MSAGRRGRALLGLATVLLALGHVGLVVGPDGLRHVQPFDAVLGDPGPALAAVALLVAWASVRRLLAAAGHAGRTGAAQAVVPLAVLLLGGTAAAGAVGRAAGAALDRDVPDHAVALGVAATVVLLLGLVVAAAGERAGALLVAGLGAVVAAAPVAALLVDPGLLDGPERLGADAAAVAPAVAGAGLGAAAAGLATALRVVPVAGTALLGGLTLPLVGLLLAPSFVDADLAVRVVVPLLLLVVAGAALLVAAADPLDERALLVRVLDAADLARCARWWLLVVVAAPAVAVAVAALTASAPGVVRVFVAVAVLVGLGLAAERVVPRLLVLARPGSGGRVGDDHEGAGQQASPQG